MELAVYFPNIDSLDNIEETLRLIDYRDKPFRIIQAFFGDVDCSEYYSHLTALEHLKSNVSENLEFSRLYFGQEFCEYLIPSLGELQKAYYFSQQLGWDFTYVTGYLTEHGLEKTKENLEFLSKEGKDIEVVANEWGLLSVLHKTYPSLKPVLGRMLIKQKRMARFTSSAFPINMRGIDVPIEEIGKNQQSALRNLNLSIPVYREELKRLGVERAELDIVPQGVNLEPKLWGIAFSCYYPWAYVTCGRNCSTAATVDSAREYVVVDKPCPRPCRKINRSSNAGQFNTFIFQRGNGVFAFANKYARPYLEGEVPVDRLIFEPYIPI